MSVSSNEDLSKQLFKVEDDIVGVCKIISNEPSSCLFYIQTHVHRSVPNIINIKNQIVKDKKEVDLTLLDVNSMLNSIKFLKRSGPSIINQIKSILQSSSPLLPVLKSSSPKNAIIPKSLNFKLSFFTSSNEVNPFEVKEEKKEKTLFMKSLSSLSTSPLLLTSSITEAVSSIKEKKMNKNYVFQRFESLHASSNCNQRDEESECFDFKNEDEERMEEGRIEGKKEDEGEDLKGKKVMQYEGEQALEFENELELK